MTQRGGDAIAAAKGHLERIHGAADRPTRQGVLDPLNELSIELANAASESSLLVEVHPDAAVRGSAEGVVRDIAQLRTTFDQDRGLYDALGGIDDTTLDPVARRVVELERRDMRRAGVEIADADRERVRRLRDELVVIEQEFARNIRDDVREVALPPQTLAGLPEDYVAAHPPGPDGKVRITTNYPDYIPFMTYAKDSEARKALMSVNYRRAVPRNLEVLKQMLAKRHELAALLGYPTWADYVSEDKMTGSAGEVRRFIEQARGATLQSAATELGDLLSARRADEPDAGPALGLWDLGYYTERVKNERYRFDSRELRPYFEYAAVRQAVLELFSELFGLRFTPVGLELWHHSVETFEVAVDGRPMGLISLDMHPREGKFKHAACFTLRYGVGGRQSSHIVLVCNFPDPKSQGGPALMQHSEVETFFHEFGHLVHGVVAGAIPWLRVVRPNEWDFIEAPSQFLEEWVSDFVVLRRFARHVETGEVIPEALVARLRAARDFGRAIFVQRQLWLSAMALQLHDRDPRDIDSTRLAYELAREYLPAEPPPDTAFEASFGHLEGYTALYYTYMWSLVIAKDLYRAFTNGLQDAAQARRYRDLVLARGGTKPAAELVRDFLGRPYDFDAFRQWLAPTKEEAAVEERAGG
ncbi:MAG: Zn-dependent oligopeptidase [Chloroflexota bacterium]|nr:Zn-dependent oligopeptidase [Chloroflexota bacterium]